MTFTRHCWAALKALLVLTVLLGVLYPAAITVLGLTMPGRAHGSLVSFDGRPVGSTLLGQAGKDPKWFQARPSASDYAGDTSGGSNWGQNAPELATQVADRTSALRAANPDAPAGPIPADALTASGSGLDPDISLAYARWQAPRVAAAWGLPASTVDSLIAAATEPAPLGFLGAEVVNVTDLNVALAGYRPSQG